MLDVLDSALLLAAVFLQQLANHLKKKIIVASGHLRPSSCYDVARGGREGKTNRIRKSSLAVRIERTLMAEDWWQVSILVPEERLTSAITVSSSSTQSDNQSVSQSIASKWQLTLCSPQEKQSCFQPVECAPAWCFWLFIQVWRKSEGTPWVFFFCVVVGRKAFASDCVLTPWNVSWKGSWKRLSAQCWCPLPLLHTAVLMVIAHCPLQKKKNLF